MPHTGELGQARRRGGLLAVALLVALAVTSGLTAVGASPAAADRLDDVLTTGERLERGDSLVSPDGRYRLQVDHFGGLTLGERPNWVSGTWNTWNRFATGVDHVVMQADGNLVAYRGADTPVYDFGTQGTGATAVRLQTDRNIVFFDDGGAVVADAGTHNRDSLQRGRFLLPGDTVVGQRGVLRLVMQTDGNLVLYRRGVPQWASGTQGNPGAGAFMQSDANLVVLSSAETGRTPLWSTGTSRPYSFLVVASLQVEDNELSVRLGYPTGAYEALWGSNWGSDRVSPGDELDPGDRRRSRDGRCVLVAQTDRNLVLYCGGRAVFSTGVPGPWPAGEPSDVLTLRMQTDGNAVAYRTTANPGVPPQVRLATGTSVAGSSFHVEPDGNLVVRSPQGGPLWSRFTGAL